MLRRSIPLRLGKPCPNQFLSTLTGTGLTAYFGVPDSLLKELCRCITWHGEHKAESDLGIEHHVIAANEGNAIGLATGYYLATSKVPVVYMQNSGLGNCVNPLTSICHSDVYSIPMILLIGWRGRPGSKADEPQHKAMGRLTTNILDSCEIPYCVFTHTEGSMDAALQKAMEHVKKHRTPYAILVDRDTFGPVPDTIKAGEVSGNANPNIKLGREESIEAILSLLPSNIPVVSTTGMISREVYETRKRLNQSNSSDFLTVGAMGHASSIAMGVVLGQKSQAKALTQSDKEAAVAAKGNVQAGIEEEKQSDPSVAETESSSSQMTAEGATPGENQAPVSTQKLQDEVSGKNERDTQQKSEEMTAEGSNLAEKEDPVAAELLEKQKQQEGTKETKKEEDTPEVAAMKEKIIEAAGCNSNRKVVCLDGDGAFLMHLGSAAITGTGLTPNNFIHIVLNNGAHDSVGGQPTVAFACDLTSIAKSCGYSVIPPVMDADDLDQAISEIVNFIDGNTKSEKPMFLEIQCKKGNRADLGRPQTSAFENCTNFMKFVQKNKALPEPVIPGAVPYTPLVDFANDGTTCTAGAAGKSTSDAPSACSASNDDSSSSSTASTTKKSSTSKKSAEGKSSKKKKASANKE